MDADDCTIPSFQVATEPFNLISVDIGHRHLYRLWQIENDGLLWGWSPHIHDGFTDFQRELDFGCREALGRILKCHFGSQQESQPILDPPRAPRGDLHDVGFLKAEDDTPLCR